MEKRKSGFYWVKTRLDWVVAQYYSEYDYWEGSSFDGSYRDSDFHKINENRIMSPDEWE